MTVKNPFVLDAADYKRNIDILKHYVDDTAFYLHTSTGKPMDVCIEYVKKNLANGGRFQLKDPLVKYLHRGENGDRVKKVSTLTEYLGESVKNGEIIVPTFTTYTNPKVKQSLLVTYIDANVKARGVAKKAMFAAKMAMNKVLEFIKNLEQGNKKISNNSISGAHVSTSTPLTNKTAHASLTSNCRSTSGNGNANNEKFLCGNRHYWNPKIALNNIVSIVNHTDYDKFNKTLEKYNIKKPTVEETMECIRYSTDLYWRNEEAIGVIYDLVSKLTDTQRAAFMYTGDLYHLAKYNDSLVREFLTKLSTPIYERCENPGEIINEHREEYRILATQFFPSEMKGKTMKDIKGQVIEEYIAMTVKNINDVIIGYRDLIEGLWVTDNVPASLAFFPSSVRRAALTSDTDSTIFTVQDWVFWAYGDNPGFNQKTASVSATMIFLAAETITHVLARMSANFGIVTDRIHQIAMKNEFKFDVFVPTQVGKHYYAYIGCREGNLFKEYEMEIKGVHLKSSNVPKNIMNKAEAMMREIMDTVIRSEKISLVKILHEVADVEREIKKSILAGDSAYFRLAQIQTAASYTKDETESPYQHYLMWQEVFSSKYGDAPPPPYSCYKVNVNLKSPTLVKQWIAGIEDKQIALKLNKWFIEHNKNGMQTMLLPQQIIQSKGIPVEIAEIMNVRKIIFDIVHVFYIILESIGFYCINDNLTQLVSDNY